MLVVFSSCISKVLGSDLSLIIDARLSGRLLDFDNLWHDGDRFMRQLQRRRRIHICRRRCVQNVGVEGACVL